MSTKVFVIADLHFDHGKVAQHRGFADRDAHNAALIEAWNSVVSKKDVVYVLGDVWDCAYLRLANGTKKLAMGNHDQEKMERYLGVFTKVRSYFEYDNCLLSHIPVHPNQFGRYRLNVHGHMHAHKLDDPRYVCVSVEQCPGFAPVLLNSVINPAIRS